ncbi:hypothetical protein [Thalassotalea sp. PS06]|uniref:hypothetical protein n=1 Tax=Thalassotalea sp. PS06 TaxID=2594005 RepID=UPI0011633018|nr:hypothetical protein [Thalassotalea sp. PS06]QDO99889.1 hypothetical protein FNC98_00100 [Thalassotalea sp. PS06]
MRKLLLALGVAFFCASSIASEFTEIFALNGKVSIQAPKEFGPMPANILEIKYPASTRPTEVLSDATGEVTLAFNHTNNAMSPAQVERAHASISKMFHNMYASATWLRDEVIEQNGQKFMVMELITPAADTQIHNIMYGTSVDGRFLLAAFNTTEEQSEKWLPIGKKIMESLAISK